MKTGCKFSEKYVFGVTPHKTIAHPIYQETSFYIHKHEHKLGVAQSVKSHSFSFFHLITVTSTILGAKEETKIHKARQG